MFGDDHYVPILKGRAAEYDALGALTEAQAMGLTPLVEVMPIPWDHVESRPAATVGKHIETCAVNVTRAWGTDRRLFVDFLHLDPHDRVDGRHPIAAFFDVAAREGLRPVAVVGVDRDVEYRAAVRETLDGQGVCMRLRSADLVRPSGRDEVLRLVEDLGLGAGDVDMLIDLRELNAETVDFNVIGAVGVLNMVPTPEAWRSLTVAASAFPLDLSAMLPASEETYPRTEWTVWNALSAYGLARMPTFGDYAIGHPDLPPSLDPRLLRVSAQLRYTADDYWLVFKERNIRDYGADQFIAICQRLVLRPEYRGRQFSWGDAYVAERADQSDPRPGNPRTWRKVGTNHHLAVVIDQVASRAA